MSGLQKPHCASLPGPTLQEDLSTFSAWLANDLLLQDWHLPCMQTVHQHSHLQGVTQRAPLQKTCMSKASPK